MARYETKLRCQIQDDAARPGMRRLSAARYETTQRDRARDGEARPDTRRQRGAEQGDHVENFWLFKTPYRVPGRSRR